MALKLRYAARTIVAVLGAKAKTLRVRQSKV